MSAVISKKSCVITYLILQALLVATVVIAHYDLGEWNLIGSLAIATVKALLVGLIFMELYFTHRLIMAIALGSFIWLAILILGTLNDYQSRGG